MASKEVTQTGPLSFVDITPVDWSEALRLARVNGETLCALTEAEQREQAKADRWAAFGELLEQLRAVAAGKAVTP